MGAIIEFLASLVSVFIFPLLLRAVLPSFKSFDFVVISRARTKSKSKSRLLLSYFAFCTAQLRYTASSMAVATDRLGLKVLNVVRPLLHFATGSQSQAADPVSHRLIRLLHSMSAARLPVLLQQLPLLCSRCASMSLCRGCLVACTR